MHSTNKIADADQTFQDYTYEATSTELLNNKKSAYSNRTRIIATGAVFLAGLSATQAAVVISTDATNETYEVSTTDLLQGIVPTNSGTGSLGTGNPGDEFATSNPAVLTDGIYGSANPNQDQPPDQSTLAVGDNVILDFTIAKTGPGISLKSVTSYSSWQDNGRNANRFTLLYSTVADPTTFIPLDIVNFDPGEGVDPEEGSAPSNTRVTITEDTTGVLAKGVGMLRFDFGPIGVGNEMVGQENGFAGYREFEATAVP